MSSQCDFFISFFFTLVSWMPQRSLVSRSPPTHRAYRVRTLQHAPLELSWTSAAGAREAVHAGTACRYNAHRAASWRAPYARPSPICVWRQQRPHIPCTFNLLLLMMAFWPDSISTARSATATGPNSPSPPPGALALSNSPQTDVPAARQCSRPLSPRGGPAPPRTTAHHRAPPRTTAHHRAPPRTAAHHRAPPRTTAPTAHHRAP